MIDVAESYNEHAIRWAERLRKGNNAAHAMLEKPAMNALVPELTGKRVLAIGCGSGEELDMLMAHGADQGDIVGIDISRDLLAIARTAYPDATFVLLRMEDLSVFDDESFDFVYSSLTMHYSNEWQPILSNIRRILKPGCSFLFSTHHPVKWGSAVTRGDDADEFLMGYKRPKSALPTVYGDYLGSRQIKDTWFGNMEVTYYHRPLGAIFADIIASHLSLKVFVEPQPIADARELNPGFHDIHSRIPLFMIFDLVK